MSESKASLIIVHVPISLIGKPVSDVLRVLSHPANRTLETLAAQVHANINNPDTSLDLLIAKLEAERKAQARSWR